MRHLTLACLALLMGCKPTPAGPRRAEAEALAAQAWRNLAAEQGERATEWQAKSLTIGDKTLRWLEKTYGEKPADGWSLWISMHGGGGAPAAVNDSQWRNQIRLYQPRNAIYVAPRAPTDNWNLWHEGHIDPLFDRLIAGAVLFRDVNPNKVYILGYSAGGDGVYQLGPRMADRFAAASMMAGHPNDASQVNLRNLPFAVWCGANDGAYDRNKVAGQWLAKLDELQASDPQGYAHFGRVVPGKGHWMDLEDSAALPWMAQQTRNPWPKLVIWRQDDVTHRRFYWLALPDDVAPAAGQTIRAKVDGQVITLESGELHAIRLRLSDKLLDLDQPITVKVGDKVVHQGRVLRSEAAIRQSLAERADPESVATATLEVRW